jgi:hypothetical protein
MKIAVYGIAKDDADTVDRWINSVGTADCLIVGDLGSSDHTAMALRDRGATVYDIAMDRPRYDSARNTLLNLIPSDVDVCVCCDLRDFIMPGWRSVLNRAWLSGTTRLMHSFMQGIQLNGKPQLISAENRIHARHGLVWTRPIKETLASSGYDKWATALDLTICRNGDPYASDTEILALLKIAAAEDPQNADTAYWLGSALATNGDRAAALETLQKFLSMYSRGLSEQRSEARRWLSRLQVHEKVSNLRLAALEDQTRREPWLDLCEHHLSHNDWPNLFADSSEALKIKQANLSALTDPDAWGSRLDDLNKISKIMLGIQQ